MKKCEKCKVLIKNEEMQIASTLYANYILRKADDSYGGDISKISSGELVNLAVLAREHSKSLSVLKDFY